MLGQRACAIGIEDTMTAYDLMADGVPYYSIWFNRNDKFLQYNGDDYDKGRQLLQDTFEMVASRGDATQYYIKIHPERQKIYKRTGDEICSIPVRMFEQEPGDRYYSTSGVAGFPSVRNNEVLEAIKGVSSKFDEKLTLMEARLKELEASPDEKDWFDRISGVLENPNAANSIGAILAPLVGWATKFIPVNMQTENQSPVIAGAEPVTDEAY